MTHCRNYICKMKYFAVFTILIVFLGCNNSSNEVYNKSLIEYRKENNKFYLSDNSPLLEEDKKNFVGLNYFPVKADYAFWANYSKYENPDTIVMPTTTERTILMVNDGALTFNLKDTVCTLQVYYDVLRFRKNNSKDYFLPLGDGTSGMESYGGGRYLELDSLRNEGKEIWLDFNKLYNPYCAYNHKFSCPIPPKENLLEVHIAAGERNFH